MEVIVLYSISSGTSSTVSQSTDLGYDKIESCLEQIMDSCTNQFPTMSAVFTHIITASRPELSVTRTMLSLSLSLCVLVLVCTRYSTSKHWLHANTARPQLITTNVWQDRQCTCNVTLRRVPATIVAVCVCSLRYPKCNVHAPYCHLWSVSLYYISPHYLINSKIFEGKKSYLT